MTVDSSDPQSRDGIRESELTHALAAVRSRLAMAAELAGRNVGEIELLAITKFFPVTDVAILSRLGCRSVGESREQEASAKVAELTRLVAASPRTDSREVHWHMVGRIQRNKARSLARWAHTAHSIDSSQLVSALDRAVTTTLAEGQRENPLRVYVQVSLDGDVSRGGVDVTAPGAVDEVCAQVEDADGLQLIGLMAIPPYTPVPERARPYFQKLRELKARAETVLGAPLPHLSMGMSGDFEVAIEEGATIIRIGTAFFGPRTTVKKAIAQGGDV